MDLLLKLSQHTAEFVQPSGEVDLARLGGWLNLRAAEFATATGQRTESVAPNFRANAKPFRPKNQDAQRIIGELIELVGLLRDAGMDSEQAATWFRTPNVAFGGRTPLEVIQSGDGRKLIDMLLALALGS